METGKHDILKKINDADKKHKELKVEIFQLLDQVKELEILINQKLGEIDIIEQQYVDDISKLME